MARGKRRKPPRPSSSVPFPWDGKSEGNRRRIEANYRDVRDEVVRAALNGERPTSKLLKEWHITSLVGARLAEPWVAGHYRGEGPPKSQLRSCQNHVGGRLGASPTRVGQRVRETFAELDRRLDGLDARVNAGEGLETLYSDVLRLCAWTHGEWVRTHPFADHNGSTARLLALLIGLRYGVPLNLPGKPRPARSPLGLALSYDLAAENQMLGDDTVMVSYLDRLVNSSVPRPNSLGV